jgi:hypothetical protein
MDPKCAQDDRRPPEKLCEECLALGGACDRCARALAPHIAKNLGWLRLMAAAEHRANPACASCHKIMDPIGFALDNFDADGKWRTKQGGDGGTPIDASVTLFDGQQANGPAAAPAGGLFFGEPD